MNYTIIGHTEGSSYRDRCGDWISEPGNFETKFFREADKAEFLQAWAHARYHNTFESLTILLDGVPKDSLDEAEYDVYAGLEREMESLGEEIKAKHKEAERLKKEAAVQAELVRAQQIAQMERERDLQQLAALQRKLGVK